MTEKELRALEEKFRPYAADIIEHENISRMKIHLQHGNVTVWEHSLTVADTALRLGKAMHIPIHKKELIRGALLHDYFLYDWHYEENNPHPRLHGFYHPGIAAGNAERDFGLTPREKEIIVKHMWPLTIIPPANREAWLVTLADKYVSSKETLFQRKGQRK